MKLESIAGLRCLAAAGAFLTGAWAPCAGQAIGSADTAQLDAAFRTCVSLYEHPLAGALMRAIGDNAVRDAFVAAHPAVGGLSIERSKGYSIATAPLKDFSVAGVAARAIYASTCELECELAVWGLEFGPLKAGQVKALQAWVESAPATPTERHGDIKVQLSTSTDGRTLLVCDASD